MMMTSHHWNQQAEDRGKKQRQLQKSPHLTIQSLELFLKTPSNSSGGQKAKYFNFPVTAGQTCKAGIKDVIRQEVERSTLLTLRTLGCVTSS